MTRTSAKNKEEMIKRLEEDAANVLTYARKLRQNLLKNVFLVCTQTLVEVMKGYNTVLAFAIVGTTRENLVLDPLAALHLDNRLHYYVDMNVGHSV